MERLVRDSIGELALRFYLVAHVSSMYEILGAVNDMGCLVMNLVTGTNAGFNACSP
jgi:hypothetical protein